MARYAFKIRSNSTKYEIDFDAMKQLNLDSKKLRIIRRVQWLQPVDPLLLHSNHSLHSAHSENVMDTEPESERIGDDERFVWEYYAEDDLEWHEYGDNVSLKIETVHHSKASIARMKIHGVEFEVRLNEIPMNQCNLENGKISEIRRMIIRNNHHQHHHKRPSRTQSSIHLNGIKKIEPPSPQSLNSLEVSRFEWRYKERVNVWRAYPMDIALRIENAFRAELDRYQFAMNGQQYELQFNFLRFVCSESVYKATHSNFPSKAGQPGNE